MAGQGYTLYRLSSRLSGLDRRIAEVASLEDACEEARKDSEGRRSWGRYRVDGPLNGSPNCMVAEIVTHKFGAPGFRRFEALVVTDRLTDRSDYDVMARFDEPEDGVPPVGTLIEKVA